MYTGFDHILHVFTDSDVPGFQCSRSLQSSKCNEVSLNAFEDDRCADDDYSELRLITDECFLYADTKWVMMECDGDSARYSGTFMMRFGNEDIFSGHALTTC